MTSNMCAYANLAYGYDLGHATDFKAAERTEDGGPCLPWLNEGLGKLIATANERLLAEVAGFREPWKWSDDYFAGLRAAKTTVGVRIVELGHIYDPVGWVLAATESKRSAMWVDTMTLDPAEMLAEPAVKSWDEKLSAATAALGITPHQVAPCWLVFPFYG